MSYCVNCGVRLESTLQTCPLCHTPIINPNDPHTQISSCAYPPFSEKKGDVEKARHRDTGIWISIMLSALSIICLALNITTFSNMRWSLPVIGGCILLWSALCPKMLWSELPWGICAALFAGCLIGYEYLLSRLTSTGDWFRALALPITLMLYILTFMFFLLCRLLPHSPLSTSFYLFVEVGFLNVGIELLIDRFQGVELKSSWSAIVFSVCMIIAVALFSLLSLSRLRNALKKRFHF